MDVTDPLGPLTRAQWRAWLMQHHAQRTHAWLLSTSRSGAGGSLTYLDAVEEALCFGWIDGTTKRHGEFTAQRYSPRRPKGNWTELNKERARRMIAAGLMTEAGQRALPDLDPAAFKIAPDILAALQADPVVWANFQGFPGLYQRVRVYNIEVLRVSDPTNFGKRLATLIEKSRDNVMVGAWDDSTLPRTEPLAPVVSPAGATPSRSRSSR